MTDDGSSDESAPPDRDRTDTVPDGTARPTGPTDKSVDLGHRAMKSRIAERMFGAAVAPVRIGRYRVEKTIGSGGMGRVYAAFDENLKRRVAIKLMHSDLDERHAVRTVREAQALARLSHPNVVHVYETGQYEGALFLVMEFIQGEQLSKWQKAQRGDWRAIVARYLEAGRGLAAAHAAGIVHRDFKPSNVVVCDDGSARVLDFGLARSFGAVVEADESGGLADASALDARVTVTGTTMGTPAYMSPEQMLGEPTNAASDQFSFCIALYEGLYGERPFAGDKAAEVYESALCERIRPAPENSKVPTRLRMILLKGLRPRPSQRHSSMSDLLRQLEGSAHPRRWRPVLAIGTLAAVGAVWTVAAADPPCETGADATTELWKQNREAVAAAFVESGAPSSDAALSGVEERIGRYTVAWAEEYAAACRTTDEVARRQSLSCLDEGRLTLTSVVDVLASGGAGVVDHAFQLVDELAAPHECASMPGEPADATQRAELMSARLDALAGREDKARRKATAVLEAARADGTRRVIGDALLTLALVETESARIEEARALLRAAAAEGLASDEKLLAADAWLEAARHEAKDPTTLAASREHGANARALLEKLSNRDGSLPGDRQARLEWVEGLQALTVGDGENATRALRQAVDGLTQAHDAQHNLVRKAQLDFAAALAAFGKSSEALRIYDEGRAAMVELAGPESPHLFAFDYGIALVHVDLGEYENARVRLEAGWKLVARAGSAWKKHAGMALVMLARVNAEMGRWDEGLRWARDAKRELVDVVPLEHVERRAADAELGRILMHQGDLEGAAEAFRDLAAGHQAAGDAASAAFVAARLAVIDLRRGRYDDARALYERHREAMEQRFEPKHLEGLRDAIESSGRLAAGEFAEAREGFERVRAALPVSNDVERWCELRAWAGLQLAKSLATDDRRAALELVEEARAHLAESQHDAGLLAEVEAFLAE